ncbi:MAG: UDP-N-acetylglucosamine 2-epimerase (non-hydrolyzing) [Methylacidiphilales bacterium]|nr:UDP-N-acetylglucosamine 2-epimerase (non-hydrolyzing) [Candidatus Methylacidiphilales bacterium]MDW8349546.1 UDP-N-acetylglucosamine 2-epimerase (non-hydrolyzing) [Verrucomicrobiae bacterium]
MQSRKKIIVLLGTRPEAIKLAPVIRALRCHPSTFETLVLSTGQHEIMVKQALEVFGIKPDIELDAMQYAQSLGLLTSRLFSNIDQMLSIYNPDWIIVQGDTTSALVGAICGFYHKIKIAHVEAGLRTYNRWAPFPEEFNRTCISHIADIHFAPTTKARERLLELPRIDPNSIFITGNTIVDALLWAREILLDHIPYDIHTEIIQHIESKKKLILVTTHRRESFGIGLKNICHALIKIASDYKDLLIVFPVHLNPNVKKPVYEALSSHKNILLLPPINYLSLVWLIDQAYIILTDSGGIQEEAPTFKKPILILRDTTERPEVIDSGFGVLVGTDQKKILYHFNLILNDTKVYNSMTQSVNPFGDGHAAKKICDILLKSI